MGFDVISFYLTQKKIVQDMQSCGLQFTWRCVLSMGVCVCVGCIKMLARIQIYVKSFYVIVYVNRNVGLYMYVCNCVGIIMSECTSVCKCVHECVCVKVHV